jgi:hypothetical protein
MVLASQVLAVSDHLVEMPDHMQEVHTTKRKWLQWLNQCTVLTQHQTENQRERLAIPQSPDVSALSNIRTPTMSTFQISATSQEHHTRDQDFNYNVEGHSEEL